MNKQEIVLVERAPCRIDLAGGTLDLWPLYLYLGGLELVQMGIQVFAQTNIEWKPSNKSTHEIEIFSHDLNVGEKYDSLAELSASTKLETQQNPLRWINRVVAHQLGRFKSNGRWKISTRSDAPPGSGLGGSSTLGICVARGLERALLKPEEFTRPWNLQQGVRDLEAIEIEHPAGDQDYVPALFGGLLIFKLGIHYRDTERLSDALAAELGQRCALLYTGKPHHSGINNWQVYTAFHQKDSTVRKALENIQEISSTLASDLRQEKLSTLADLINQEWHWRQKLSNSVNAPVLEDAWGHCRDLGAVARKACGAGGGGCLLAVFGDSTTRNNALKAPLPRPDWKWLTAEPALRGCLGD